MRQKHPQSTKLICRIDVTAFAAIMFALVGMFLLPATIIVDFKGPGVDLARVDHTVLMRAASREDALIVAVQRDGKIFFGHDQLIPNQLPARIREAVSQGAERKVYIRADARAKYAAVGEVLEAVQDSGIEKIAFLVDQRKLPQNK
ncbi:MAG TPA: biopolymer transporter ExbD [Candidatus Sulfotelmatobacter sp.]|nr:biopolymer transporter ExbD [Candidatus Sulfotelmatobacter sp.]